MSTLSLHPGSNCSTIVRSILIKYCLTLLLSGASRGVISARFIKTEKYWLTVSSNVWRLFSFGREISQNFSVSMNLAEISLGEDSDWKKSCTKQLITFQKKIKIYSSFLAMNICFMIIHVKLFTLQLLYLIKIIV